MKAATYLHLPANQSPPSLESHRPFRAVLVIEQPAANEWQTLICEWLVRCGCLYVSAWGYDCESWHDTVDHANMSAFEFHEIPDDAFVMTTWHAREPLAEVLWFAAKLANHPTVALDKTIIIHISAEERRTELLKAFQKAYDKDG